MSKIGKIHAISGLAIAGSIALGGVASAQMVGREVKISGGTPFKHCTADDVGGQPGTNFAASAIEPWIAVDPTRAGHLLTGVQQDRWSDGGSRGLRAGVSFDAGKTWASSIPHFISECTGGKFQRSTDPWTAFGADGTAYFFSLAFDNNPTPIKNGENALLVSRSTDGGLTWQNPRVLIDDTDPLAFNDKNSMTADPKISGNAYAVWDRLYGPANAFKAPGGTDEHGASVNPAAAGDGGQMVRNRLKAIRAGKAKLEVFGPTYFSRTTDSGRTWSRAAPIYDPGIDAQTIGNVIVVTPAGELINFFDHITAKGALSIDYVRSFDHGLSWTKKPESLTPFSGNGAVTPDTAQPVRGEDIIFSVSVNPKSGALYVVWEDIPAGAGSQLSILFSQSTDDGKTWSAPAKVNQTPASGAVPLRGQGFNGNVVAAANGTLVVTYYDFRNDQGAGGQELADAWVVFCQPGSDCTNPANWGHEARLTSQSFDILQAPLTGSGYFLGDYFGLTAQKGDVWPVYTAVSGPGQTSLFTRRIRLF